MKKLKIEDKFLISRRLAILLYELEQELKNTTELLIKLKGKDITKEQAELNLGELSAAITHLHEHTNQLDELIINEIN